MLGSIGSPNDFGLFSHKTADVNLPKQIAIQKKALLSQIEYKHTLLFAEF